MNIFSRITPKLHLISHNKYSWNGMSVTSCLHSAISTHDYIGQEILKVRQTTDELSAKLFC